MKVRDASFDEFVRVHVGSLMSTAFLLCCDEDEAEDLVQECLLKVSRRWRRVGRMAQPLAYTRRVLVNLVIDSGRTRARRRQELSHAEDRDSPSVPASTEPADRRAEEVIEAVARNAELLEGLHRLSPQQRAVVVLRYFQDLSEAETARTLGCSVGTVKSSTSRALARMRETIEPCCAEISDGVAPTLNAYRSAG